MSVGKLYMIDLSPPCRAVLLTAKVLNIQLETVRTNIIKGENLTPGFLKMNPAHSLPTYLDNDLTAIGDSHAIMIFLVNKYGKKNHESLYPKDLTQQAKVNQCLLFDAANIYSLHIAIVVPMWMRQDNGPNERQLAAADTNYQILNTFLEGQKWVAGTANPTIADFSLVTSVTSFNIVAPFDADKYRNILPWIKRCEALPFYNEVDQKGREQYKQILIDMLNNKYDFMEQFE